VRVALNVLRDTHREVALEPDDAPIAEPAPEFISSHYRVEVEAALKAALSRLGTDERELLRLHYLQGLSLSDLGRQRGVDKSTLSRKLATVRRMLLAETRRELARLVPTMTTASRDSLLLAVRSRINISLATAFRP
jgi:RNA polymerase sigma-70 factor (ECF subfamily)